MKSFQLPFRQIHMDFHTSELIPDVALDFDAQDFAQTLKQANVNSVTCFARCHHGWIYYDSKLNSERIHPNLKRKNLLLEQIQACHDVGIRVPIYTTVQFDQYTVDRYPEWLCRKKDGSLVKPLFETGFYKFLCVNTAYRDFLKAHVDEILQTLPTDGLFLDIVWAQPCCCPTCEKGMLAQGMNPEDPNDVNRYGIMTINDFVIDMSSFIRERNQECSIYYNNGAMFAGNREHLSSFTHLEFDALPAQHGSYEALPIQTRNDRTLGIECVGQTARFQTGWGDFHSYKNQAALDYECFLLLSLGAKCMIGDQLHPSGKMNHSSYELIGRTYGQVASKEPWCQNAAPVTDIGLIRGKNDAVVGAASILEEAGHQFDVLDKEAGFSGYKLLLLPDDVIVDEDLARRLSEYVSGGGAIIASFESGMNADKTLFQFSGLGIEAAADQTRTAAGELARGVMTVQNDFSEYIIPKGIIGEGLPETEHVMYSKAVEVVASQGSEVLLPITKPYFYRTAELFCSHMQTPSSGEPGTPAVVRNGNVIYFSHAVFTLYREYGALWVKRMVLNAINSLLIEPLLRHNGPTTLRTTVNEQATENRWIVHCLHYVPVKKAKRLEVVEEYIPLYNLNLSVRMDKAVNRVLMVPENTPLDYKLQNGRLEVVLPELKGHQMISIEFK